MKSSRIVPIIIIVAIAAFVIYSMQGGAPENYEATILKDEKRRLSL